MSLVNLLPEDFTQRRAARRTNAIALVMFAIVMAGTLAGVSVNQQRVNSTQTVLNHVTSKYHEAAKGIEKVKELDAKKKTMQDKSNATGALIERQPRSYLIALVANSIPETACVVNMKVYPKKVVVAPPPTVPGAPRQPVARNRTAEVKKDTFFTEMEIMGLATTDMDVSALMSNLNASKLVNTVDLIYSQDKQLDIKDPVTNKVVEQRVFRDFKLRVGLNPDVDVMDILTEQGDDFAFAY